MTQIIALVITLLEVYRFVLIARILLSWFQIDRSNPTVDSLITFLYRITEPVLQPVREVMPRTGGIDLSPLIVFFGIQILISVIAGLA